MPWKEPCAMDQRVQLIGAWLSDEYCVTELSELYGVSRKTIYKWIKRYEMEGTAGLEERSRETVGHTNAIPLEVAAKLIAVKLCHQKWGPKKVTAWLRGQNPE